VLCLVGCKLDLVHWWLVVWALIRSRAVRSVYAGGETTCKLVFSVGPMGKILVVENERRLCAAIVAHLKSKGAHPIAATTMQEAIITLDEGEIDLVVLDLKLGNGDGMDVLRHIRRSPDLAILPVLVVSAWEMEPASYDYLEPGDYLTKPFDMRMLDLVIRQLLASPQDQRLGTSSPALSLRSMDHEIGPQT
jgi:DNA-binding response OmpR family regulator